MFNRIVRMLIVIGLFSVFMILATGIIYSQTPPPPPPDVRNFPISPLPPGIPSPPKLMPINTSPNFDKISLGMTPDQVRQLVGVPGQSKKEWKYNTKNGKLEIKFLDDRIISIERD